MKMNATILTATGICAMAAIGTQSFAADLGEMINTYAMVTISKESCAASWHLRTDEVLIRSAAVLLSGSMTLQSANRVFELADAKAAEMRASGDTGFNSPFCDMVRTVAQQSWTTIPQNLREP
jgi:hypothetical protein